MLHHAKLPSGFNSPAAFIPVATFPLDEAVANLRTAIQRVESEPRRAIHPGFGKLSREEWDLYNLRHAEMQMSFLQFVESTT
jgi:hypothetical protein